MSQGDAWLGSKRVGCEWVTGSPSKRETSSNGVGSIFWFSYWCIFNIGSGALCSITSGSPGPTVFLVAANILQEFSKGDDAGGCERSSAC